MSYFAADVVASADNSCEPHSNLHHQSPSILHHGHHGLTTRHPSTAAQTLGNDGKLATANPVLSASGLIAHGALDLERSSKSHTIPSLPFEVSSVIGGPATQFGQSEEPTEDMSMSNQNVNVSQPPSGRSIHNNIQGSPEIAGQDITEELQGQKCLRYTKIEDKLIALIRNHVKDPRAVDPGLQKMNLAEALLPFYEAEAQPPDKNPYMPTVEDLETRISPILNNGPISVDDKCTRVLRRIDYWYGGLGWAAPLGTSKREHDSAVFLDMSRSSQSPNISRNPTIAALPQGKHFREGTVSAAPPAKRSRMEPFGSQTTLQSQMTSSNLSPDHTSDLSSQNLSQGFSQSKSNSEDERSSCLLKKCRNGDIRICKSKIKDQHGMMLHIERTHYPPKIFICDLCHHMSYEKYNVSTPHLRNKHPEIYGDEALRSAFEDRLIVQEIDDTFCDICPLCEGIVPLGTYKDFMQHIEKHVRKELTNHPYRHRCTGNANHDWTKSRCIPEKYRQKIEGKRKPGSSCGPADPRSRGDEEDDNSDDDSPRPPPPGGKFYQGSPGQYGSGVEGRGNADAYSSSGNYVGTYCFRYSSQTSTMPLGFARISGNSDSSLRDSSQSKNSRITTPGINLIKKCFRSIRKLGRGGFGTVDEVLCKPTNKTYARKIIPLEQTAAKVSAEVEILKQLRHQHIINLAAYCTTSDQLWLFMTPVAEGNLATYLRGDSNFSFGLPDRELLRTWESDLISALKYLHGREILHGDIKPQNMLVSSDMKIYLSDFGSARAKYIEQSHGIEPQPASALTPKYSAPEVSYHKSVGYSWEIGAAADIFSLGCVWAEIETVYTGLSILVFETFRSGGSSYNSFQANLPKTYIWLDFLWVLQESNWQTSRLWGYGPSTLQKTRDMLSFDPQQRPNADQLTAKLHYTAKFDTDAQCYPEGLCERPSSAPVRKSSELRWTDDLVAKRINTFSIKPFNCWKATTEGFSPNGCIDTLYRWDTGTTPKGWSAWLEGRATSAEPVFFKPLSNIPITFKVVDGCHTPYDMVLGKSFLQKDHAVALQDARSLFETRPLHVKGLAKSQCLQQHWEIPQSRLAFSQPSSTESLHGDLQAKPAYWMVESLSDYLRETSPPSSAEDTLNLWNSAAGIFKWVDLQNDELSRHKVTCGHLDLKLENILVYRSKTESPYVCRWKISDVGISHIKQKDVLKEDNGNCNDSPDVCGTDTRGTPEITRSSSSRACDKFSLGCILFQTCVWVTHGSEGFKDMNAKLRSQPNMPLRLTKSDVLPDEYESYFRERSRNANKDLLEALAEDSDFLTRSIAESVIAPMLEPLDKQPSWKWIHEKAQTLLNDARDALNDYKKTVTKAAAPLLSFVRSKITSTCISSTRVIDGSRSGPTEIFVLDAENGPDGRVEDDACHTDVGIDPNIFPDGSGYSYCLERYLRDNSDSRYLFPARGCNASKELNKIYLGNAIERFQRMFIDAR